MIQNPQPVAVTLFSGLGSTSKALRDLGYAVIPHDFMPEAVATLKANGFTNAQEVDVRDIDWSRYSTSDVKVLAGGPPCQPFSQSHDGDGRYDERDMIPEFLRAVASSPEVFIMEEVQTLTWAKHIDYLEMVEDHMRALGYVVEHRVLNAADYFIPQARKRLFVIGVRADLARGVKWPVKSTTKITMAEALGWTENDCWIRNEQVPDARAFAPDLALWPLTRPAVTVVGSFRPEVAAAPGYRKAGDPPRQGTPGSVVTTLEERLILQDMPTDWVVCGNEQKRALQVGNSVPCGLMRELVAINTGAPLGGL